MGGGLVFTIHSNLAYYSSHKNFGLFIKIRPIVHSNLIIHYSLFFLRFIHTFAAERDSFRIYRSLPNATTVEI